MLSTGSTDAFKALLDKPSSAVIITHMFPDADAVGSSLALAGILKILNHQASVLTPNACPNYLAWMCDMHTIINAEQNPEISSKLIQNAGVIYCLDFSQKQRIGPYLADLVDNSSAVKVLIDHHTFPQDFANIYLHDITASSTAEIVFKAICTIGQKNIINKSIAEYIYTGLVADTGSFRHPSTTAYSHRVAADLMDIGVNVSIISDQLQDNNSVEKVKFFAYIISNNLTIVKENHAAYITVSEKDLNKFKLKYEDTECIMPQVMSIKDITCGVLFKEIKGKIKVSLRSKGDIRVNDIAIKYFDGGGHKNAAGGTFYGTMEEAIQRMQQILDEQVLVVE
jgi:phosphoesterase RecJ-like protein